MARLDNLESNPITRQGKSAGGFRRGLPNLGAPGPAVRAVRLNGEFTPALTPEEVRSYLLPENIYGRGPRHDTYLSTSRNGVHSRNIF